MISPLRVDDGNEDAGRRASSREALQRNEETLHALMLRAIAGDSPAYTEFLQGVAASLRPYFRRRLFKAADQIEDLVQEVLIAIHTKRATFDASRPITVWVHAIARYKLIDHLRRTRRQGVQVPLDSAGDLFAEAESEAGIARRDLERLLDRLPSKQRVAIRLVKIEELSVREAAERSKLTESDIKVSVHRGIRKLAQILKGES